MVKWDTSVIVAWGESENPSNNDELVVFQESWSSTLSCEWCIIVASDCHLSSGPSRHRARALQTALSLFSTRTLAVMSIAKERGRDKKRGMIRVSEDLLELGWRATMRKRSQNERPVACVLPLSFPFCYPTSRSSYIRSCPIVRFVLQFTRNLTCGNRQSKLLLGA